MHRHHLILCIASLCLLVRPSVQQVNIKVEIAPDNADNITLSDNTLSAELSQANLTQGYIQSIVQQELLVDICSVGTFSSPTGGECVNCPAGTASPVEGASNDMTCAACSAGTFAGIASSACTNCPVNTFSPQYKAASVAECIPCPSDTTSTVGSDNVRSCVCNSGFFVSNNLISPFDGVLSALGFDGAVSINVPHVAC
jgi:hypothetical protein